MRRTTRSIDIDAFNWVRQVTDTTNSRYALAGTMFDAEHFTLTCTNGVALLRAHLSPVLGEAIAQALGNESKLLMFPSGTLRFENSIVSLLNKENISIYGNTFEISTDRFPNTKFFWDNLTEYSPRKDMIPFVDPHYLNMFFPKRTKNSRPACDSPPSLKINPKSCMIYVNTFQFGFEAEGFISGYSS